jgi:hypothetical protein
MSGPRDASLKIPAVKWWLAISRDMLAKDYRRMAGAERRPLVHCHKTPTFVSPLHNR